MSTLSSIFLYVSSKIFSILSTLLCSLFCSSRTTPNLFNIIFFLVLISVLLQGQTLHWLAEYLKLKVSPIIESPKEETIEVETQSPTIE